MIQLPRLYAILDVGMGFESSAIPGGGPRRSIDNLIVAARELVSGGATLLQYRNKWGNALQMLDYALNLKREVGGSLKLIMNDRADLCVAAGFDGVHIGGDDLSVVGARKVIGDKRWLGLSTHNPDQVIAADKTSADYVAIGPVFSTSSKSNPDPPIGLNGVGAARRLTRKPLVAIGGITRANCQSVVDAGADSVALISDLLPDPRKSVEEFLRILG